MLPWESVEWIQNRLNLSSKEAHLSSLIFIPLSMMNNSLYWSLLSLHLMRPVALSLVKIRSNSWKLKILQQLRFKKRCNKKIMGPGNLKTLLQTHQLGISLLSQSRKWQSQIPSVGFRVAPRPPDEDSLYSNQSLSCRKTKGTQTLSRIWQQSMLSKMSSTITSPVMEAPPHSQLSPLKRARLRT